MEKEDGLGGPTKVRGKKISGKKTKRKKDTGKRI